MHTPEDQLEISKIIIRLFNKAVWMFEQGHNLKEIGQQFQEVTTCGIPEYDALIQTMHSCAKGDNPAIRTGAAKLLRFEAFKDFGQYILEQLIAWEKAQGEHHDHGSTN